MTRQEVVEVMAQGMHVRNCGEPRERQTPAGPVLVVQACPGPYTHKADARLILTALVGPDE